MVTGVERERTNGIKRGDSRVTLAKICPLDEKALVSQDQGVERLT